MFFFYLDCPLSWAIPVKSEKVDVSQSKSFSQCNSVKSSILSLTVCAGVTFICLYRVLQSHDKPLKPRALLQAPVEVKASCENNQLLTVSVNVVIILSAANLLVILALHTGQLAQLWLVSKSFNMQNLGEQKDNYMLFTSERENI